MKETLSQTNGRPAPGLTPEERRVLLERHLRQQEAQAEELRLSYLAAQAAVAAVRQELEG